MSKDSMKKTTENELENDLRPEYNFAQMSGGVRGKYADRCQSETNIVVLEPDVAQAFPTEASVNEALRLLIQVAQRQQA
ncbi:hypothetical protein C1752_01567 [Acaryochloris thomasi RCC1774]|uniref:Uncharacterized protein n=2 Tax=Acaryochloris TaxID=155977 RepID=A0A2W1K057_9CYAN|nr:hypothetical protein C1752_01567 [Acaryochloris thomasi RCC1774]